MNTKTILMAACLAAAPCVAGPILPGVWYEFSFTDPGVGARGCSPADPGGLACVPSTGTPTTFLDIPPWTITLPAGGTFTITDAFLSGDAFEVLDFGIPFVMTPFVAEGAACGDDPVPCLADAAISHAVVGLASGAHSFTIAPLATVLESGAAYFRIDTAVPEPSAWVLIVSGLLGLAARARHKR